VQQARVGPRAEALQVELRGEVGDGLVAALGERRAGQLVGRPGDAEVVGDGPVAVDEVVGWVGDEPLHGGVVALLPRRQVAAHGRGRVGLVILVEREVAARDSHQRDDHRHHRDLDASVHHGPSP
jgi:hypothetical protein